VKHNIEHGHQDGSRCDPPGGRSGPSHSRRRRVRRRRARRPAGAILTFGVKPTYPASSYGYIRALPKEDGSPVRKVEAFVEKPDATTAARYVADGNLWNSGNFMFRAEVTLRELGRLEPEIRKAVKGAVDNLGWHGQK
jgi:mannose-1-phosphate guanylyltransferase